MLGANGIEWTGLALEEEVMVSLPKATLSQSGRSQVQYRKAFRELLVSPLSGYLFIFSFYLYLFSFFISDTMEHSLGALFLPPPKCGRHANLIKTRFFITNEVFKHKTYFYTNLFLLN